MSRVTAEHYWCACAQRLKAPERARFTYRASKVTKLYDASVSGAFVTAAASAEWGADDTAGVRQQCASWKRRLEMLD
jgi:hypothetical protein